jgi:hypothetical protein
MSTNQALQPAVRLAYRLLRQVLGWIETCRYGPASAPAAKHNLLHNP